MINTRFLKIRFTSTITTLIITLLISACSTEDNLTATPADVDTDTIIYTETSTTNTNSPAVISGVDARGITEDVGAAVDNLLEQNGKLNITDSDAGEAAFIATTINGDVGSLTIDTAGNWYYAAINSQAVIQNLASGETLTDNLTVSSVDGTTHTVVITIVGVDEMTTPPTPTNSPAVISGVDARGITEDVGAAVDNLLEQNGKLNITDSDAGEAAFIATTINGDYGSLTIDTTGNWYYAAINSQAVIQNLASGETLTDSLTVNSVDGTTHDVVITILGVDEANQTAVITGVASGNVTEDVDPDGDSLLEVAGKLNITDNDSGEAAFIAKTANGNYGRLTINTTGNWNYAASNSQTVIQNLATGTMLTDTLTVSSIDGTTRSVVITINGVDEANQPAVITGVASGNVTEDVDPDGDNLLEVTGKLNITDNDSGEAAFIAKTHNGNYGSLTINTAGNWNYAANNNQTAIQNLASGDTLKDNLTVSSVDGTTHAVVITIIGADEANQAAVISGVDRGTVTEDIDPDGDNLLEVAGKLNITDNDAGEAAFIAKTASGNYGSLAINTTGNWSYAAGNNQTVIQNLASGETLTDSLTVSSVDGTTHVVVITIIGADEANQAAVITGVDRGTVTEDIDPDGDNLLEVAGKLNITDNDAGEAAFIAATTNGNYGSLAINTTGNWSYAASNNQAVIQNLASGATLIDNLTISSLDGTTHTIIITITGADETSTAANIDLSWVAPAEREDNTSISLSEIDGYKIYYGANTGQYTNNVTINDGSATSYTFNNLPAGTYYFVVTTIDTEGRESAFSVEVIIST